MSANQIHTHEYRRHFFSPGTSSGYILLVLPRPSIPYARKILPKVGCRYSAPSIDIVMRCVFCNEIRCLPCTDRTCIMFVLEIFLELLAFSLNMRLASCAHNTEHKHTYICTLILARDSSNAIYSLERLGLFGKGEIPFKYCAVSVRSVRCVRHSPVLSNSNWNYK